MDSFERFSGKKIAWWKYFYRSLKNGTTNGSCEKLDVHVSDK